MRPARSVFVIHPGALGDVLLSLQALTVLRRHHPTHHLVLVARSDIGILLERGGVVDQTYPVESGVLASLFAGPEYVDPPLQRLLRSCDHAVAWLDDADHSLQHTFMSLGVGRMTLEAPKPRAGVHQSLRILQTVTEDLPSDASACPLYVDESSRDAAGETLRRMGIHRPYVVCHPGSGSPQKCASPLLWSQIVASLGGHGRSIVMASGPAEEPSLERMKGALPDLPWFVNEPLGTVAGLLAGADIFIGHDSGVSHLAAAVGTPAVALFGPTDPRQWAPVGRHVEIATGQPCSCRSWDEVRACVQKPCLEIPLGAVIQACDSLLERYHPVTKS